MLRLWKVRPGGHAYYLDVTPGEGSGVEPAGQWSGRGRSALGLRGRVDAPDLAAVLAGSDPATAVRLSPAHDRVRVAAFDLTFCAPKSVSLLHGLSEPDVAGPVEDAHRAAVAGALDYLERRGAAVRRIVDGRRVPVPVAGITAAAFRHSTSRALDPHLHTHVVVANLGRAASSTGPDGARTDGPAGAWSALDGRGFYAHRAAADALYHAQLRHELTTRLGVGWGPVDRGRADVAGIDEPVRRLFSRRAMSIAAQVNAWGGVGAGAAAVAAASTRPARDPTVSADDLRPGWRTRARAAGLGPTVLDATLDRTSARAAPGAGGPLDRSEEHDLEVLGQLAGAVGARAGGGISRRQVVRLWAATLAAGAPVADIEAGVDRLIEAHDGGRVAGVGDGPGVAERRFALDGARVPGPEGRDLGSGRGADRGRGAGDDRRRLEELLGRRGMVPAPELTRRRGDDVGLGLG